MRVEDVCICVLKVLIQSRELRAIVCENRAQTGTHSSLISRNFIIRPLYMNYDTMQQICLLIRDSHISKPHRLFMVIAATKVTFPL